MSEMASTVASPIARVQTWGELTKITVMETGGVKAMIKE